MKFLKTFLVILFSFALIGSQSVFDSNGAIGNPSTGKTSARCSCSMTDCCMQQSSEIPSQPLASLPVNPNVQTQQFVAAICTILLQQPVTANERVVLATIYSLPSAPAVPLLKQNCTYLI